MTHFFFFSFLKLILFGSLFLLINQNSDGQTFKPLNFQSEAPHKTVKTKIARKTESASSLSSERFIRCSTMEADATLRKNNPTMPGSEVMERELQKKIKEYKRKQSVSRTNEEVYVIPVIVHIVHNGESVGAGANITAAQVRSQIEVLNEDFRRKAGTPGYNNNPVGADINIEFALALRDPNGVPLKEPGIHRVNGGRAAWESRDDIEGVVKPQTQWDPNRYLNMWTVAYGGDMSKNLGYAQFPVLSGLPGLDDRSALANTDGLVMGFQYFGRVGALQAPYDKGRTATHEIGHWLGLKHIWGDDEDCSVDDHCADTPAASEPNHNCPVGANSCSAPGNDMIENYMDYTEDGCMNIFTQDQKTRMRTVMEVSPRRKELLKSTVHIPSGTGIPLALFTSDKTNFCLGTAVNFTDQSQNAPTSWKWYIIDKDSTVFATSTQRNPTLNINKAGVYTVALVAANNAGRDSAFVNNYLTIVNNVNTILPFAEDFEKDEVLTNWIEYNPDRDRGWNFTDVVNADDDGLWSIYFDNYTTEDDPSGTVDALISSRFNFSTSQFAEVSFDVAYAPYEDEDGFYSDTLVLYYSTDCGATFTPFWAKWGNNLATSATTSDAFIPESWEWRKEKVSLAFLNGKTNVHLALGNVSGWGNYLFVDNLQINVPEPTEPPVADFSTSLVDICEGSSIQFSDYSSNNPRAWSWKFEGGIPAVSSEQNPTVKYNTPGKYRVTLTSTNKIGTDTKTEEAYITVVSLPSIVISSDKNNICPGDSVILTASGGRNYTWSDNRGEIGKGNSIKVKPSATNTYFVRGENANKCSSGGALQIVVNEIEERPVVTVKDDNGIDYILMSNFNLGNQWMLNGKPIAGATSSSYSVKSPGLYSVLVTTGGCSVISNSVTITGVEDDIIASSATLFPNPTDTKVTISFSPNTTIKDSKAILYNSLGIELDKAGLVRQKESFEATFNMEKWSRGTYFIRVEYNGRSFSKTFIKN